MFEKWGSECQCVSYFFYLIIRIVLSYCSHYAVNRNQFMCIVCITNQHDYCINGHVIGPFISQHTCISSLKAMFISSRLMLSLVPHWIQTQILLKEISKWRSLFYNTCPCILSTDHIVTVLLCMVWTSKDSAACIGFFSSSFTSSKSQYYCAWFEPSQLCGRLEVVICFHARCHVGLKEIHMIFQVWYSGGDGKERLEKYGCDDLPKLLWTLPQTLCFQ